MGRDGRVRRDAGGSPPVRRAGRARAAGGPPGGALLRPGLRDRRAGGGRPPRRDPALEAGGASAARSHRVAAGRGARPGVPEGRPAAIRPRSTLLRALPSAHGARPAPSAGRRRRAGRGGRRLRRPQGLARVARLPADAGGAGLDRPRGLALRGAVRNGLRPRRAPARSRPGRPAAARRRRLPPRPAPEEPAGAGERGRARARPRQGRGRGPPARRGGAPREPHASGPRDREAPPEGAHDRPARGAAVPRTATPAASTPPRSGWSACARGCVRPSGCARSGGVSRARPARGPGGPAGPTPGPATSGRPAREPRPDLRLHHREGRGRSDRPVPRERRVLRRGARRRLGEHGRDAGPLPGRGRARDRDRLARLGRPEEPGGRRRGARLDPLARRRRAGGRRASGGDRGASRRPRRRGDACVRSDAQDLLPGALDPARRVVSGVARTPVRPPARALGRDRSARPRRGRRGGRPHSRGQPRALHLPLDRRPHRADEPLLPRRRRRARQAREARRVHGGRLSAAVALLPQVRAAPRLPRRTRRVRGGGAPCVLGVPQVREALETQQRRERERS